MTPLDSLITTLSDEAARSKVAHSPWRLFAGWVAGASLYVLLLVLIYGLRPDFLPALGSYFFIAELIVLSLVVVCCGLYVVILSYPDMYQAPALVFAPLFPLVGFMGFIIYRALGEDGSTPLPPDGIECLLCISLFSVLPACVLFCFLRRQATTHIYAAGAVALMAAFALGALALRLSEPTDSMMHLLRWHYIPMLASSVVGLVMGRIILKW